MPKSPRSRGKLLTFLFRSEGWGSVVRPGSAQLGRLRQQAVAEQLTTALSNGEAGSYLGSAVAARDQLVEAGFQAPVWADLTVNNPARPRGGNFDDVEPARPGWQQESSLLLEERLWPRLTPQRKVLFRSQGGPMASVPCTCFPIAPHSRFNPQPFRVLLLRRLWLPLLPTARNCRCGLPLDSCGHHRAACAAAGVQGRRGFAAEAAARNCREAGARVSLDVRVQDMDLTRLDALDNRRLEIVADGLPLFQGAQLAVDTTLVSALRHDGVPHSWAENHDGAVLDAARRRKERTYPELTGQFGRTRLVVLAGEVAGRWSEESRDFLSQLAKAKEHAELGGTWATLLQCFESFCLVS